MSPGVAQAFSVELPEFLQNAWDRTPVIRSAADVFQDLLADGALQDFGGAIASHGDLPILTTRLGDDGFFEEGVCDRGAWTQQLAEGWSHGLLDVQLWSSAARAWCHALAADLGLPVEGARAVLFVTDAPHGRPKHFDERQVFVVQLAGAKRWWLAENTAVSKPRHGYHPPASPHPELLAAGQPHVDLTWPPGPTTETLLSPGDVLYCPRGWWHRTLAEGRSISLSVGLEHPG